MLGVVIVAYRKPERTIAFVRDHLPRLSCPYKVVVVNNESDHDSCLSLARGCGGIVVDDRSDSYPQSDVFIVRSEENLGFAKGNNLGVRVLERIGVDIDRVLFTNDDIIIGEDTDISGMLRLLDSNESIGAIGPDIIGLDGSHQSPHRRLISAYRQIGWLLFSKLRRKRQKGNSSGSGFSISPPADSGFCYWLSGAFFLMRLDDIRRVGGFDGKTFLYSEEPILAERLKAIGKRMYFYPGVRVTHMEGGSTDAVPSAKIRKCLIDSNCIYYRDYLKTPSFIVWIYKYLSYRSIDRNAQVKP